MPSPSPLRPASGLLDRAELRELVTRLAADPARWRPLARPEATERHFERLLHDERVEVWVISWADGSDTGFHDHDTSHGAVGVAAGTVREETLTLGGDPAVREVTAGSVFSFDATDIHRVLHIGDEAAVTLHLYSPPLRRMGAYEVLEDGRLARRSISAEQELGAEAATV
ncbi:MAG TPA: cysteine dioxygenase family protein [Solirubrobacteraceae bacterium]